MSGVGGGNWGPHQIGLKKRVRWSRTDLGRDRQRERGGERRGARRDGEEGTEKQLDHET